MQILGCVLATLKATQGQIPSQFPTCHLSEEEFECELTTESIVWPLGCLQGGVCMSVLYGEGGIAKGDMRMKCHDFQGAGSTV